MAWNYDSEDVKVTNSSEITRFGIDGLLLLKPIPVDASPEELLAVGAAKIDNLTFTVDVAHGHRRTASLPVFDEDGNAVLDGDGNPVVRVHEEFVVHRMSSHTLDRNEAASIMLQPVPPGLSYYDAVGAALYQVLRSMDLIPPGSLV